AIADTDIGLDDADQGIHDDNAGDHEVEGARCAGGPRRLGHPVADRLSAAKDGLFAWDRQIAFDLDQEVRVGEPEPVAGGWAVEGRVALAPQPHVLNPWATRSAAKRSRAPAASSGPFTSPCPP